MWFGVNLLFKSIHLNQPSDAAPLWEETIVLVRADSEEQARIVGEQLGKAKEVEYLSASGDTVHWSFERVESVHSILDDTLKHGTEVFSRYLRTSEVESILTPFGD